MRRDTESPSLPQSHLLMKMFIMKHACPMHVNKSCECRVTLAKLSLSRTARFEDACLPHASYVKLFHDDLSGMTDSDFIRELLECSGQLYNVWLPGY